jgi:hypothetical protein
MFRAPEAPEAPLNPRGEITTGLAILRLTGLGYPRVRVTSPVGSLRLRPARAGWGSMRRSPVPLGRSWGQVPEPSIQILPTAFPPSG